MGIRIGAKLTRKEIARLLVLSYGIEFPFRIFSLHEIQDYLQHVSKPAIADALNELADEGLVTRFAGRYCFNLQIPPELQKKVEEFVTKSGTMRADASQKQPGDKTRSKKQATPR
jgi:hypothetical protein